MKLNFIINKLNSIVLVFVMFRVCGICAYNLQHLGDEKALSLEIEYFDNSLKKTDSSSDETIDDRRNNNIELSDLSDINETIEPAKSRRNYIVFISSNTDEDGIPLRFGNDSMPKPGDESSSSRLDSWSVIWYIASFGGLIAFFLVVSCSEWCCRRHNRNNCSRNSASGSSPAVPDSPPPSYHNFAPPSYESLCYGRNGEKSEFDIYVVPVHAMDTIMEVDGHEEDAPPSYLSASKLEFSPTYPVNIPQVHCNTGSSQPSTQYTVT